MFRNLISKDPNGNLVLNTENFNKGINLAVAALQDGQYIEPEVNRAWATSSMDEKREKYTFALAREQLFNRIKNTGSIENFKVEITSLSEDARTKFIKHHVSKKLTSNEQQPLKDAIISFVSSLDFANNEAANPNKNIVALYTDEKKNLLPSISEDDSQKDAGSANKENEAPVEAKKSIADLLSEANASYMENHSIEPYKEALLSFNPEERSEVVVVAMGERSEDFVKSITDLYETY